MTYLGYVKPFLCVVHSIFGVLLGIAWIPVFPVGAQPCGGRRRGKHIVTLFILNVHGRGAGQGEGQPVRPSLHPPKTKAPLRGEAPGPGRLEHRQFPGVGRGGLRQGGRPTAGWAVGAVLPTPGQVLPDHPTLAMGDQTQLELGVPGGAARELLAHLLAYRRRGQLQDMLKVPRLRAFEFDPAPAATSRRHGG